MESLKIGKEIYSLLNGNEELTKLVGNKIYPIIVEKETTFPFIVYKRTNLTPEYTKDYHLKDNVYIEITCVSDNYSESIDLVSIVRKILENKRDLAKGITNIILESANEDFIDDAYIQTINFKISINK